MLDYDTWQNVKTECENDAQVSFQRMSRAAQKAMQDAHVDGARIATIVHGGAWIGQHDPAWFPGGIYRVNPTWTGPAKPEPKPEYVDQPVVLDGVVYKSSNPTGSSPYLLLPMAPAAVGFAGYVYEINGKEKLRPRLLCDQQPDGTYRLRVPKAVRFLRGAKA